MNTFLGSFAAASLIVLAPASAAAAQAAPPAPATAGDAAKLAEAHAIIAVMFPPAERKRMMDKLLTQLSAQFSAGFPAAFMTDPGLKAIVDDFMARAHGRQLAVLQKHMPSIFEATAIAYTHEFSLAELKDIHAFAETPAGRHYLSRATALIGDPAVANANKALIVDAQALTKSMLPELKEKLVAYVKAHPDVAAKIAAKAKDAAADEAK